MSKWIFFSVFLDVLDFSQCVDSAVFWFVVVKGLRRKCIHKMYIQLMSFIMCGDLANYGLIPLIFEVLEFA